VRVDLVVRVLDQHEFVRKSVLEEVTVAEDWVSPEIVEYFVGGRLFG
jgi:hypothetical protein